MHALFARHISLIILLMLAVCPPGLAAREAPSRILIIHSYHRAYPWTDNIDRAIHRTFRHADVPVTTYVEYLHTKRLFSQEYAHRQRDLLLFKYQDFTFDLIIVCDDGAFRLMRTYDRELFPGVPVILAGITFLDPGELAGLERYTGVNETPDIPGSIALIRSLHPGLETIAVIVDSTITGDKIRREVDSLRPVPGIDIVVPLIANMEDLTATVRALPANSAVLFTVFSRDATGRFHEYDLPLRHLAATSPRPHYVLYDFQLGMGAIGGLLTGGDFQGEQAGRLALRILEGSRVAELPMIMRSPSRPVFDHRQLEHWGIRRATLPQDSLIINTPPSLLRDHPRKVLLAGLLILLLSLTTLTLWVNILRRRRAEKKLRQSEEHYRGLFAGVPIGLFRSNRDGDILDANPALTRLLGYTRPEELRSRNIATLYADPRDRGRWQDLVERDGIVYGFPSTFRRPDGTIVHGEVSCHGIRNPLGETQWYEGAIEDVTARRERDEERQRLTATFSQATDGMVITDSAGNIEYVNPAFTSFCQIEEAQLKGRHLQSLGSRCTDPSFTAVLQHSLNSGQPWSGRMQGTHPDGKKFTASLSLSAIHDDQGERINFLLICHDATAAEEHDRQLRQTQKLEAVGTLASGIAHDFNNILTSIIGFTELALDEAGLESKVGESLQYVLEGGAKARDLIRQILTFSRGAEQERSAFALASLINEAITFLSSTIPPDIEIKPVINARRSTILADPVQIQQVLINLCINAAQAMAEQGGTITITLDEAISPDQELPGLSLSVRDTGIGMDEQTRERIFEPFFSTKAPEKGTGLGLAITHGIVTSHGGTINVRSTPGQGSTFNIFLPAASEEELRAEPTEQPPVRGQGQQILFVDDEPRIVKLATNMLINLGYKVTGAGSAREALAALTGDSPSYDLLITDHLMPRMSGLELQQRVRQTHPDLPIIMISGSQDARLYEALRTGLIRTILPKPFLSRQLATACAKALEKG